MAVKAWTSPPIGWTSDSELQTWLTDLFDNLTGTGGLVQTADTGQLDHTTVVVPAAGGAGTNTYSLGYWVFRFNDDLQSTDPIFIKIEVVYSHHTSIKDRKSAGTAVTVGTGSNGSGVLTGTVSNRFELCHLRDNDGTAEVSPPNGQCKVVFNENRGFLGVVYGQASHKVYYASTGNKRCVAAFFISRKQLPNGLAISGGFTVVAPNQIYTANYPSDGLFNYVSWLRSQTITSVKYPEADADLYSAFPFMESATAIGDEAQCMRHYHLPYQEKPTTNYNMVAVYYDVIGSNQEFELVSGGTEPSNFICLGREYALRAYNNKQWTIAILWE